MVKNASQASGWFLLDVMRGITADEDIRRLYADQSAAEGDDERVGITSSGFKATHPELNTSGDTYIYVAIRRPNKPAEEFEPEELFAIDDTKTGGGDPRMVSGFPVDFAFRTQTGTSDPRAAGSRMTQGTELLLNDTNVERTRTQHQFDYMNGWLEGDYAAWTSWMWRRAPGFFDVVTYEGIGGQPQAYNHGLGVEPEMFWVKNRGSARNWAVWHKDVDRDGSLNSDSAFSTSHFNGVTEDTFICTTSNTDINRAGDQYIAYLFASVPGISKVGSYTGNGSEVEVDCGFTTGARWLLVKRVDSTGDWYFTSNPNNFKTLAKLNTTDAQSNYMSTYNDVPAGFRVTSTSANLCVDGAEYIFYAIA